MERISVSVRKPVKQTINILCAAEDRTLSEMSALLIEEALDRRLNPKFRGRPGKPAFKTPSISTTGVETYDLIAED